MRRKVKSRSTSGRFFVDFDMVGIVDLWLSWGDATKSVFDCASAARSSLVSLISKHYVQDVFPTQTYCKARVLITSRIAGTSGYSHTVVSLSQTTNSIPSECHVLFELNGNSQWLGLSICRYTV